MRGKTVIERIKELGYSADLAKFLCAELSKDDCDRCPVGDLCKEGRNGFMEWLGKESKNG